MDETRRHLQLLTETIDAVNSTLDLEEVLGLVARKVADALGADACFVYLYDERARELVLRATHGTRVEEMTKRPRLPLGQGITGVAAEERQPVMLPADAHLDPRFRAFPNLPEDRFQSILAVPILSRHTLEGALNVRTIAPREFSQAEIDLLLAIAAQVAHSIQLLQVVPGMQSRPLIIISTRLPPQLCGIGTFSWLLRRHWPGERASRCRATLACVAHQMESALHF